jgi:hypothetical protein
MFDAGVVNHDHRVVKGYNIFGIVVMDHQQVAKLPAGGRRACYDPSRFLLKFEYPGTPFVYVVRNDPDLIGRIIIHELFMSGRLCSGTFHVRRAWRII